MTVSTLPQLVTCPYCHDPVPGLLAGCDKPACRTKELDDDARFVRNTDI